MSSSVEPFTMVKLSEEMITARTRVSDMGHVKKLNCWGADLTDVSVLRQLRNVEVLSLSVNNITTLADVQDCKNLQVSLFQLFSTQIICFLGDFKLFNAIFSSQVDASVLRYFVFEECSK
jgi:hypothetical protein